MLADTRQIGSTNSRHKLCRTPSEEADDWPREMAGAGILPINGQRDSISERMYLFRGHTVDLDAGHLVH